MHQRSFAVAIVHIAGRLTTPVEIESVDLGDAAPVATDAWPDTGLAPKCVAELVTAARGHIADVHAVLW